MTSREWHVTWRSIIVPLLAPETRTWTATRPRGAPRALRSETAKIMNGERVSSQRRRPAIGNAGPDSREPRTGGVVQVTR